MICVVDENGPVAAKLYPARGQWAKADHRPHYQPDYARRGYSWLFGALNPQTGEGLLAESNRRDSASFTAFMDQVDRWIPLRVVHLVIDNLSIHISLETLLWNLCPSSILLPLLPHWSCLVEPDRRLVGNLEPPSLGWSQLSQYPRAQGSLPSGTCRVERQPDSVPLGSKSARAPKTPGLQAVCSSASSPLKSDICHGI